MSVKITDLDAGFKRALGFLTKNKNISIKLGVFGEKARAPHVNETGGDKYKNIGKPKGGLQQVKILTVGDIALINEYGLGNVPARPFISGWMDQNANKKVAQLTTVMKTAINDIGDNGRLDSLKSALDSFAAQCVNEIQTSMMTIPPALSPRWAAFKMSANTLVFTGQLRAAVDYKVTFTKKG